MEDSNKTSKFCSTKMYKYITKRRVKVIEPYIFKGDEKSVRLEEEINRFLEKYDNVDENAFVVEDIKYDRNKAVIIYKERKYKEVETENLPASFDGIPGYDLSKELDDESDKERGKDRISSFLNIFKRGRRDE